MNTPFIKTLQNSRIQTRRAMNIALVVMAILLAPVSAFSAQLVDINNADAETMIENWKGIGEKKARAIVAYRKKNGKFKDINDLANVDGIGEGLIKNNRKYMSVSKGLSKPSGKSSTKKSSSKDSSKSKDKKTSSSSSSKQKSAKKDDSAKKSSSSKKSTSKKSTTKKSSSKKKSKTKKCKKGSKDKDCIKKSSKKKKNSTT